MARVVGDAAECAGCFIRATDRPLLSGVVRVAWKLSALQFPLRSVRRLSDSHRRCRRRRSLSKP